MRYLLIGNYGVGNLGDEALKEYFLNAFPEVEWVVISNNDVSLDTPIPSGVIPSDFSKKNRIEGPEGMGTRDDTELPTVPRLPFGWRSLWKPWWRTVRAYWKNDGVVFGGGSLFTDIESVQAPILWWWHAFVAWVFRKPIFLAFQGVGPFRTTFGEWVSRWVVRHATFISVRDHQSFERVRKWRSDVVESFDPVLVSLSRLRERARERVSKKIPLSPSPQPSPPRGERGAFVLIPRSNSDEAFLHRAEAVCVDKNFSNIFILSLQPNSTSEKAVCKSIQHHIPGCQIIPIHSLQELSQIVASASFVLSERFHGALAALAFGIPFDTVPQATGDKLMTLKTMSKEEALTLVERGEKALRYALNV